MNKKSKPRAPEGERMLTHREKQSMKEKQTYQVSHVYLMCVQQ